MKTLKAQFLDLRINRLRGSSRCGHDLNSRFGQYFKNGLVVGIHGDHEVSPEGFVRKLPDFVYHLPDFFRFSDETQSQNTKSPRF